MKRQKWLYPLVPRWPELVFAREKEACYRREKEANSRYFYELASARFGWSIEKAASCQAFHFKGGQGAKTGTGGHLPGEKVVGKIAEVRGLEPGTPAISPSTFVDLATPDDYRAIADEVRDASGGILIGFKLSAQHIEADIDFALEAGADYIILDGRGGEVPVLRLISSRTTSRYPPFQLLQGRAAI